MNTDIIENLFSKIEKIGIEMQQLYYANQNYFDKKFNAERLGLDNVVGNMCLYDMRCLIERGDIASALKFNECNLWFFDEVMKACDRLGYGAHGASYGFDMTRPAGRYWTLAEFGRHYCEDIKDNLNK